MNSKRTETNVPERSSLELAMASCIKLLKLSAKDFPIAGVVALKNSFIAISENPRILNADFIFLFLGEFLVQSFRQTGPVFVKLGQILAARDDLIPKALCKKLTELYDSQPPVPFRHVEKVIHDAYKANPFESVNPVALGVGSVGQVHRAQLRDGTQVVVKVIKPGAEKAAQSDLMLLGTLTSLLRILLPSSKSAQLNYIEHALQDLSVSIGKEFNLEIECMNLLKFKERCRRNPQVYIPDSYPSLSKRNILVMEYIEGVSLGKITEAENSLSDKMRPIAKLLLKELLEQVFDDGSFHADPHAGNLLLMKDGRIAFIDLGLTGEMTPQAKAKLVEAMKALLARNPDRALEALLSFAIVPEGFDRRAFREKIATVYRKHSQRNSHAIQDDSAENSGLEALIQDLFRETHAAGLYVPESTTLFIKAMVTIEAVARSIDPQVNIKKTAVTVLAQSALKSLFAKLK